MYVVVYVCIVAHLSSQTPPPSTPDGGVQKLAIHGGELLTSSKVKNCVKFSTKV